MKDLKYLIYFENLLQEANNELVQQAKAEGEHALGYTCYFVPETLLNLPGCFSMPPACAELTGIASTWRTYYMSSKICYLLPVSILERGIEGRLRLSSSALLATETCSDDAPRVTSTSSCSRLVKDNDPQFFVTFLDMPFKVDGQSPCDHYVDQLRAQGARAAA